MAVDRLAGMDRRKLAAAAAALLVVLLGAVALVVRSGGDAGRVVDAASAVHDRETGAGGSERDGKPGEVVVSTTAAPSTTVAPVVTTAPSTTVQQDRPVATTAPRSAPTPAPSPSAPPATAAPTTTQPDTNCVYQCTSGPSVDRTETSCKPMDGYWHATVVFYWTDGVVEREEGDVADQEGATLTLRTDRGAGFRFKVTHDPGRMCTGHGT